jgi:hypothetical protein
MLIEYSLFFLNIFCLSQHISIVPLRISPRCLFPMTTAKSARDEAYKAKLKLKQAEKKKESRKNKKKIKKADNNE